LGFEVRYDGNEDLLHIDINSYLDSPAIKILVGAYTSAQTRAFFVHRKLLESRSTKSALDQEIGTSHVEPDEEHCLELSDEEPTMFKNYVHLLYLGVLPIEENPPKQELTEKKTVLEKFEADTKTATETMCTILTELYVLSIELQDIVSRRFLLASFTAAASKLSKDDRCYFLNGTAV
jgi:hypothetical protein